MSLSVGACSVNCNRKNSPNFKGIYIKDTPYSAWTKLEETVDKYGFHKLRNSLYNEVPFFTVERDMSKEGDKVALTGVNGLVQKVSEYGLLLQRQFRDAKIILTGDEAKIYNKFAKNVTKEAKKQVGLNTAFNGFFRSVGDIKFDEATLSEVLK